MRMRALALITFGALYLMAGIDTAYSGDPEEFEPAYGVIGCVWCADMCPPDPGEWCAERWCSEGGSGSICATTECQGANTGEWYEQMIMCP